METVVPEPKKKRLSLSRSQKEKLPQQQRFQLSSSPEVAKAKKGYVPPNTLKSTAWAVRVFEDWRKQRNSKCPSRIIPDDVLLAGDNASLCEWLCVFCKEARKQNGEPYTPRSISQLLAGIQRYMHRETDSGITLLDGKDPVFQPLHRLLDSLFRDLHAQGIGATRRRSSTLSKDDEDRLWSMGVLGVKTPEALLNAVFFYNGMFLILRGGEEHRKLKLSQFKFSTVPDPKQSGVTTTCVTYTEHGSKNHPGGTHQLNLDNKEVAHYACPAAGERCYVSLLQLYISKLPASAFESDIFYHKPRQSKRPFLDGEAWYEKMQLGHNRLSSMLKDMLVAAGVDAADKSNHSLRATGICRLFTSGVPEKLIMERSGHISTQGVRAYERTTAEQMQHVSDVLSGVETFDENFDPTAVKVEPGNQHISDLSDVEAGENSKPTAMKTEPGKEPQADPFGHQFHLQDLTGCTFNITMNY